MNMIITMLMIPFFVRDNDNKFTSHDIMIYTMMMLAIITIAMLANNNTTHNTNETNNNDNHNDNGNDNAPHPS